MSGGVKAFTIYNHMLLPAEFESLEADYWHLLEHVQVWDVGAERQVSIKGPDATRLVQWMTPRAVAGIATDQCAYLPLADERGKLINDPVGIRLADDHWWLSVADSDVILWAKGLARGANLNVVVDEPDVWPLAVQGPKAEELMARIFGDQVKAIRFFRYERLAYRGHEFIVARSGWSKQGGFEIYVDNVAKGQQLYDELFKEGEDLNVRPGCPNLIERIESGLLSHGNDMDSRHSVLEAGLGGFISLDQDLDSLSHEALRAEQASGVERRVVGLVLPSSDEPTPLAEMPFVGLGTDVDGFSVVEAIPSASETGHFVGSQVWSPRYKTQLATAMLEEPLASESSTEVRLADRSKAEAKITSIPFDFNKLGLAARVRWVPELPGRSLMPGTAFCYLIFPLKIQEIVTPRKRLA